MHTFAEFQDQAAAAAPMMRRNGQPPRFHTTMVPRGVWASLTPGQQMALGMHEDGVSLDSMVRPLSRRMADRWGHLTMRDAMAVARRTIAVVRPIVEEVMGGEEER
jgi:hypothetical protein